MHDAWGGGGTPSVFYIDNFKHDSTKVRKKLSHYSSRLVSQTSRGVFNDNNERIVKKSRALTITRQQKGGVGKRRPSWSERK